MRYRSKPVMSLLAVSAFLGTASAAMAQGQVVRSFRASEGGAPPAWAEGASRRAAAHLAARHGDRSEAFSLLDVTEDDLGLTHTKVRRTLNGVPVLGLDSIVETGRNGGVVDVLCDRDADLSEVDTNPTITAAQAVFSALSGTGPYANPGQADSAVLVVFAMFDTKPTLCWQVTDDKANDTIFVNAKTGAIVYRYPNYCADAASVNVGTTYYSGGVFKLRGTYSPTSAIDLSALCR